MATAAGVLDVARAELGYVEQAGNRTKYGAWYGTDGQPWCAIFVSWVADRAGAAAVIPKHAYTPSGAAWFTAQGRFGRTPQVGAVVYYEFPGMNRVCHVGVVESLRGDGSWVAIEGNTDTAGGRTGGQVMRRTRRTLGARGGFGYPAYDGADPAVRPVVAAAGRIAEDGDLGPKTITRLQQSLNATGANPPLDADGELGPMTTTALQQRLNATNGPLAVSGVLDAATVRALQANVGAGVDGQWGPLTTTALQRALNSREL